jgi:DsbC/DsbD-like thiol-disulfide interchange protein
MVLALTFPTLLAAQPAPGSRDDGRQQSRSIDTPATVSVESAEVKARIALSEARVLGGKPVGVVVDFEVAPGWHVYGEPLPEGYAATRVIFDNDLLSGQRLNFPKPTPVKFELLGDTLPVYQGHFRASGNIHVRQKLAPGEHRLEGTVKFQECNDNLCKMPQEVRFKIPLWIDSPTHQPR